MGQNDSGDQTEVKVTVLLKEKPLEKQLVKAGEDAAGAFFEMVEKIQQLTWSQLWSDKGLNLEKETGSGSGALWSVRVNRGWRAFLILKGNATLEIAFIKPPAQAHTVRQRTRH